ncbi:DUF3237 domain-containing protein [Bradyrhizobium sp. WSM 1791]|uniref:DUF3237 domain-containing protein n=1 Tax=Bradyrhizobium australiense TaxID=2721161 RepID=A0A7Y4GX57_9BRAD|nr:DUF3237 domain-containing protein [Bradyrhizobium australiense]
MPVSRGLPGGPCCAAKCDILSNSGSLARTYRNGPRIKAQLAATGIDWMQVSEDGFWRPNVRAQFLTDDGAVILMSYVGLVEQTAPFKQAAETNGPTAWDDQYMRLSLIFNTGDRRYAWLNQSLFIAAGRLLGTGSIEYSVFRVT